MITRLVFSLIVLLQILSAQTFTLEAEQFVWLDTIRVKGDHYYPPFEFINEEGRPDGFNIELFRELAKELKINYTLELGPWCEVRHELETGQIDVITGMMVSESRSKKMKFGTPHSIMTHAVFSRKSNPLEKLSDLRNKEIVVQQGDQMHDILLETKLTDKIIIVNTQLEALNLINGGKYDAALIGTYQGSFLIKEKKLKNIHVSGLEIDPQMYAIAVSLNNDELLWLLNMGLFQLKANGVYDQIYYKWFGVYEDYSFFKKHKKILGLIVFAIILMLLFILFLRHEIQKIRRKFVYSESRNHDIFENNHAVTFILEPVTGQIVDANPAAIKYYGYPKKVLTSMKISDINTLKADEIAAKIKDVGESKQHFFSFKHRLVSGEIRDVEVYSGPVRFGENQYLYSIVHDVTDKKVAEEALRKSEEKLKLIYRLAPSGLGIIKNKTFVEVNQRYCEMTGYSSDELIGQKARLVFCSDEEHQSIVEEMFRQIKEFGIGVGDARLKTRSGNVIDVVSSSAAIDSNDLSKGVIFATTDVTKQKESTRQFHLANERIRLQIENSPLAFIEWDNKHRVKFWSNQAEQLFGWTKAEVASKYPLEWDFVYKEDVYRVGQSINRMITGLEKSFISHNRNNTKNGRLLHCQWYNSAIYDEDGALISILSLVNDVTDLKTTEKKLTDEQRRLSWFIDATRAGTWEWDIKNDNIVINDYFASMLGYEENELTPFSFKKIEKMVHSDDFEEAEKQLKEHFSHPSEKYDIEARFRHKDGKWTWIHIIGRVIAFSPMGEPTYMVGMNTNINRRKSTEEKLSRNELLLSIAGKLANLGGWSADLVNNTIYWSDEVAKIHDMPHGYSPTLEEAIQFYTPEYRIKITDVYTRCVEVGTPFDEEMQIKTASGRLVWVRAIGVPKFNNKGVVIGVQGGFQDITIKKNAEKEIMNLNADLEKKVIDRTALLTAANKELEAFSYSVSHDLRAPLRAIDGFTRILTEDHAMSLDAEGLRICSVIVGNTKKMNHLINDLLTFSKLGRSEIKIQPLDMKALIASIYDDIPKLNSDLQFHIDDLEWCLADATLIKQVWLNLISNAIKFTSKTSNSKIWISGGRQNNQCIYWIQDNGVGFDMAYSKKIFEVFQRLHVDSEFEGTGVGLAIVQRIIHRHGGEIWAEGVENQGATFTFTLPAVT
jgi:PAS domain S-box-containing protein